MSSERRDRRPSSFRAPSWNILQPEEIEELHVSKEIEVAYSTAVGTVKDTNFNHKAHQKTDITG